jgi:hypothetical protein
MEWKLVVVRPFGTHLKGDVLSDATLIARVLASDNARDVVRVTVSTVKGG